MTRLEKVMAQRKEIKKILILDPYQAKKIIDTYVEKIILYPDNRVEVILKFNIPTDPNGSNGKKSREYNVGAEGASLTYTHRFSLA